MPELFGYEPNADGDIEFMTIRSDFVVHNFEEYMEFFKALVQIAVENNVMPIYRPESAYGTDK